MCVEPLACRPHESSNAVLPHSHGKGPQVSRTTWTGSCSLALGGTAAVYQSRVQGLRGTAASPKVLESRYRGSTPQTTEKINQGEQYVQHYLQFVAPPRFPYLGSVVPRFMGGHIRDCSARASRLMYSQETDVSSEVVPWSPSASSICAHAATKRLKCLDSPQVFAFFMRCSPRVRNSASSENIAEILQDVGREGGAHDVFVWSGCVVCTSRARSPAKQCFEMFPTNR